MRLVACEWRKLLGVRTLWAFVALCLAYNALIIGANGFGCSFFNDASAAAGVLGQRVDQAFLDGLEAFPPTENRDVLLEAARSMHNIYASYDTSEMAAYYGTQVAADPLAASLIEWKYGLLQPQVDHLASTGAAMDVYAGPATHDSHWFLFGALLETVVGEAALLGMIAMLSLLGHESQHRTDQMAYATRTGRRLVGRKVVAGLTAAVVLYLLLAAATLGLYFSLWNYGGVWDASVSSQFNYVVEGLYQKPFLAWADFSVAGYLVAVVALGAVLVTVCALIAAVCGVLVRNVYAAALVLAVVLLAALVARSAAAGAGMWAACFALCLSPTSLWVSLPVWFTEMGLSAVLPFQETIASVLNLVLFGAATELALRRFGRKDVVPWNF